MRRKKKPRKLHLKSLYDRLLSRDLLTSSFHTRSSIRARRLGRGRTARRLGRGGEARR
jgi:hypothetical protein